MCLYDPNLYVISGGPGSGKTTVLRELERLGFSYAPEVARQIIQEQVQSDGTAVPWGDRVAYTSLMLERSIDSYKRHSAAATPVFCDRGIPDTLGYARLIGLGETGAIEHACATFRYAPVVFLAPPWQEIYVTDNERKQNYSEALQTFEVIAGVYRECGYDAIELPRESPRRRAEFIVAQLG